MRRGDAREKSRRIPIAALGQRATGLDEFRAFRHAALHQLADFFQLRFVVDRADVGVFVQRIAEAQGLDAVAQLADDFRVNAFLHQQSRAGTADVAVSYTHLTLPTIYSV